MSQRQAACKLNAPQSLLGRMLKSRQAIENENSNRKRKRAGKEEVEEALKQWFTKVREKDARVTGPLLRQKPKISRKKWVKMILWQQKVGFTDGRNAKTFHSLSHMENREKQTK